jgi:hypothetical protein
MKIGPTLGERNFVIGKLKIFAGNVYLTILSYTKENDMEPGILLS